MEHSQRLSQKLTTNTVRPTDCGRRSLACIPIFSQHHIIFLLIVTNSPTSGTTLDSTVGKSIASTSDGMETVTTFLRVPDAEDDIPGLEVSLDGIDDNTIHFDESLGLALAVPLGYKAKISSLLAPLRSEIFTASEGYTSRENSPQINTVQLPLEEFTASDQPRIVTLSYIVEWVLEAPVRRQLRNRELDEIGGAAHPDHGIIEGKLQVIVLPFNDDQGHHPTYIVYICIAIVIVALGVLIIQLACRRRCHHQESPAQKESSTRTPPTSEVENAFEEGEERMQDVLANEV